MNLQNLIELTLLVLLIILFTKPLGIYLSKVLNPKEKTFLDWLLKPLEKFLYRLLKINPEEESSWKKYLLNILIFSAISFVFLFLLINFQAYLPINENNLKAPALDVNVNTSISFITNTNWQCYIPEKTLSNFSQMVGLTVQNFLSASVGICVAATLVRGLSKHSGTTLGNFWVDMIRSVLYLLLPLSFILAVFFISEGVPQTFRSSLNARGVENSQVLMLGPVASQESIKLLGSNGGGFFYANSSHPFENPTPFSNFIQILSMLIIPAAFTYYFGKEIKDTKHGWSLLAVMMLVFIVFTFCCSEFESEGSYILKKLNHNTSFNMEGKEERFGIFDSALFAITTTSVSCGAVNSSHDSFTPLGGMFPLINLILSDAIFGGVGTGLYFLIIFVITTIFIAGLIVGRTPEYLQKKIEAQEIKTCVLIILVFFTTILGLSCFALLSKWGVEAIFNPGAHGITEIVYAYASCASNNGSAFEGLNNTKMLNYTTSLAMLIGRYGVISLVVFLSNLFLIKKKHPKTTNIFPFSGPTFILLLTFVIISVGVLTFIPIFVLGPILEQLDMQHFIF
jgi:potassium-transporting ATPase potassium-binding subunit